MTISRMQQPRQMYGLGSFVKKAVKGVTGAVKSIAKSDVGKMALLLGGGYLAGGGGMPSFLGGRGLGGFAFGNIPTNIGGIMGLKSGKENLLGNVLKVGGYGTVLGGALAGYGGDEEDTIGGERNVEALRAKLTQAYRNLRYSEDQIPGLVENDLAEYTMGAGGYANGGRIGYADGTSFQRKALEKKGYSDMMQNMTPKEISQLYDSVMGTFSRRFQAYGGRIGYNEGTDFQKWLEGKQKFEQGQNLEQLYREYLEDKRRQKVAEQKTMAANGGRIGYAFGNPEQNAINAAGIMNLPLNQNPAGVTELDLRETGGFIPPVGVKEKADDIPAMLSNNEFVFTADAVRNMGDGNVNEGAQRMYDMMKKLEEGGRV
jgi:hypothetical protein